MPTRKGFALLVPAALALVLASIPVRFDPTAAHGLRWIVAAAEKGGSSGNGGGSGGSGGDSGGSGSGSSSGGNGGGAANGGGGSSGSGGGGGGGGDTSGRDGGASAGQAASASRRGSDGQSGRSGGGGYLAQARVEVDGSGIQVITGDGFRQTIEHGRFELKDPMGRTVVRRSATAKDRARLFGYLR